MNQVSETLGSGQAGLNTEDIKGSIIEFVQANWRLEKYKETASIPGDQSQMWALSDLVAAKFDKWLESEKTKAKREPQNAFLGAVSSAAYRALNPGSFTTTQVREMFADAMKQSLIMDVDEEAGGGEVDAEALAALSGAAFDVWLLSETRK